MMMDRPFSLQPPLTQASCCMPRTSALSTSASALDRVVRIDGEPKIGVEPTRSRSKYAASRCPRMLPSRPHRGLVSVGVSLVCLLLVPFSFVSAQPPGTAPPRQVIDSNRDRPATGVRVEGFYFLDQSGTRVFMPAMSWEELERLRDLRDGIDSRSQASIFESLEITGKASGGRAEMEVSIQLTVEPTGERRVAIPLRMASFNLLRVQEVSGVDRHWVTVAEDGSGYLLWLQTATRATVKVKLLVAARVDQGISGKLQFDLPEVPSMVRIEVDQPDLAGEVVGRGDEVVQSERVTDGPTQLTVESSGGNFELRWSPVDRGTEDAPLLEVESRVNIRWDGPQDQPIASIQMTIRNLRGSLTPFAIRLPPRSILLEPPTVEAGTLELEIPAPVAEPRGPRLTIPIPEEGRLQRIDLSMDLQLENVGGSSETPLPLTIPTVIGALRHEGDLQIETGSDFRLRWDSQPWIQSVIGDGAVAGSTRPRYFFRFDRDAFRLPIWLSAQRRQLRLTGDMVIVLDESTAQLTMDIRPSGQSVDGRVTLDIAGWKLKEISDLETGEPIDSFDSGGYRELTLNTRGGEEPAPVRLLAEAELESAAGSIRMLLPRIVEREQSILVQESALTVRTGGRNVFVVDLAASSGVDRVEDPVATSGADAIASRFRLLPSETPVELVGTSVEQPQRITLAGNATVALDGWELQTTVDWTLTSQFDLEGRLLIQIDRPGVPSGTASGRSAPPGEAGGETLGTDPQRDGELNPAGRAADPEIADTGAPLAGSFLEENWSVMVDDVAALLRPLGNDRYELISDRLTSGPVLVRWRLRKAVPPAESQEQILRIPLPRPVLIDTSIRGAFSVAFRGDETHDLVSDETPGTNPISLDALPRDPIRVRIRMLSAASRDLVVRQAILRTAIGEEWRHEQILAKIQGGDSFDVSLPVTAERVVVEARVDGERVGISRRGTRLAVPLPSDDNVHAVDIRIWIPMETALNAAAIKPVLELPAGVSRVYWQLTVPKDAHVVWASPTVGRAMQWRLARWWLHRDPIESDESLGRWIGIDDFSLMPPGNRYLYVGSNVASFQVAIASRGLIWVVIGSIVLFVAAVMTYLPQTRHPLLVILAAVLLVGLLVISPDAAVLAGQLGALALVLVVVMLGMRSLLSPKQTNRALSPVSQSPRSEGSTHSGAYSSPGAGSQSLPQQPARRSSLAETQSMASPTPSGEVS